MPKLIPGGKDEAPRWNELDRDDSIGPISTVGTSSAPNPTPQRQYPVSYTAAPDHLPLGHPETGLLDSSWLINATANDSRPKGHRGMIVQAPMAYLRRAAVQGDATLVVSDNTLPYGSDGYAVIGDNTVLLPNAPTIDYGTNGWSYGGVKWIVRGTITRFIVDDQVISKAHGWAEDDFTGGSNSPSRRIFHRQALTGTVQDTAPTTSMFVTSLADANQPWTNAVVTFTSGALSGTTAIVAAAALTAAGKVKLTLTSYLAQAPANGDSLTVSLVQPVVAEGNLRGLVDVGDRETYGLAMGDLFNGGWSWLAYYDRTLRLRNADIELRGYGAIRGYAPLKDSTGAQIVQGGVPQWISVANIDMTAGTFRFNSPTESPLNARVAFDGYTLGAFLNTGQPFFTVSAHSRGEFHLGDLDTWLEYNTPHTGGVDGNLVLQWNNGLRMSKRGLYGGVPGSGGGIAGASDTGIMTLIDALTGQLTAVGVDISGTLHVGGGSSLDGPVTLGAAGGIYQGTGTFDNPITGYRLRNNAGFGIWELLDSGVAQVYAGTDGKLYWAAGKALLDATGIILKGDQLLQFQDASGNLQGYLAGYGTQYGKIVRLYSSNIFNSRDNLDNATIQLFASTLDMGLGQTNDVLLELDGFLHQVYIHKSGGANAANLLVEGWLGVGNVAPTGNQIIAAGAIRSNSGFNTNGSAGLASQVVALAKLTAGGANGSITITGGLVTAYSAPT